MADSNQHPGLVAPNSEMEAGPSRLPSALQHDDHANSKSLVDEGEDLSDTELMEQLEQELDDEESGFNMSAFRERRMEQLREELASRQPASQRDGTLKGKYTELKNERDLISLTAQEKYAVVHFAHRDFRRCKIMDKHLGALAPQHSETAFIKILVEDAPFLVEKLGVKVLPCVICFIDGVSKDRLIGFEELGNQDGFATKALEFRLRNAGVLQVQEKSILGYPQAQGGGGGGSRLGVGADDLDDWD